jgi:hypothetical protein
MAVLNIGGKRVTVDDSFLKLPPDQQNATVEEIAASIGAGPAKPQGVAAHAMDFVKSIPRGLVSGLTNAQNTSTLFTGGELEAGLDRTAPERVQATEALTNSTYAPQGPAGKVGAAVGGALGDPVSYLGPGGALLKTGTAVLGGIGGEVSRQAAEGTKFEIPAQIAGAVAGGVAGAKTLGPRAPNVGKLDYRELKDAATSDYKGARATGFELHPQGLATFASKAEQNLSGPDHGFTGGKLGDAPKAFNILDTLQKNPARFEAAAAKDPTIIAGSGTVSASNLDAIRKNLGRLSRETAEGKPTPDAAAASIILEDFNKYLENIPQHHILAGNADEYLRLTKQGNANYAAAQRVRVVDQKIANATRNTEGAIATSLDNQIKSQIRNSILNNPRAQRGWTPEELAAANKVNKGTFTSNTLRQLGRGGSGVVPIGIHLAGAAPAAAATGGVSLVAQALLAAGLYGAKKTAEGMTKSDAADLAAMLAKRSPEYNKRAAALPAQDKSAATAAVIRALLTSGQ